MRDPHPDEGSPSGDEGKALLDQMFREAQEAVESGRLAEAAGILDAMTVLTGGHPFVFWNLGLARSELEEHGRVLDAWEGYRRLVPDDWRARAKVIQACQALGDAARVEREREELLALRRSGADAALSAEAVYRRERFRAGGRTVLAHEVFEPQGERRVFYQFHVLRDGGEPEGFYSLGSYDATTQMMREIGDIGPDERLFHLDWYHPQGHATLGFFQTPPSYDETRAAVVAALEGRAGPIGSSGTPFPGEPAT